MFWDTGGRFWSFVFLVPGAGIRRPNCILAPGCGRRADPLGFPSAPEGEAAERMAYVPDDGVLRLRIWVAISNSGRLGMVQF